MYYYNTFSIENIPVVADDYGPFGSPTSDSDCAMISENAKEIVMCIYSFSGDEELKEYLNNTKELLEKYAESI